MLVTIRIHLYFLYNVKLNELSIRKQIQVVIIINNNILLEGAKKFGADHSELKLIGGFSNNVFGCRVNSERFILKHYLSSIYDKDSID